MSTVYWIYKNGHQSGPFTFSKIRTMWNAGSISVADQIRRTDRQEWRAVSVMSDHLELGHNVLARNAVAVIMLGLLALAFVWSFRFAVVALQVSPTSRVEAILVRQHEFVNLTASPEK